MVVGAMWAVWLVVREGMGTGTGTGAVQKAVQEGGRGG